MRHSAVRRFGLVFLAFFLAIVALPARAQWAIYFQGSGATLHVAGTNNVYGSTFGFYDQKGTGALRLGIDFRGAMLGAGNAQGPYSDERLDYGLFGARVATKPLYNRFMPYAEGLVGGGYFREGIGVTRQDHSSGSLQAVGGVDVKIHGAIQWRVAEVSYGRVRGQLYAIHPVLVSTGILFQLP